MEAIGRLYCPQCEAQLRRGRPPGLCDPCLRKDIDINQVLPPAFYAEPQVGAALGVYDFGRFFRTVRQHATWTQEMLAEIVGLTQADISKIENGAWRLRDITTIRRVAERLLIPAELLRVGITVGSTGSGGDGRNEVVRVDRRQFSQHAVATVLGLAATAGLDLDRLTALLPTAEPTGTRHVGLGDVEFLEQITAMFKRQDFTDGSGQVRAAAVGQLRTALPLLDAQVADEVGPRLRLALAHLAMQAGYMSFNCNHHDAARRLWLLGLTLTRQAKHPLSTDLTVYLLHDLALQAVHVHRPDEALHFVRIGHTAAVSTHPVSASTTSCLTNVQALAHAAQGDTTSYDRALGQASEHFAAIDPTTRPLWGAFLDKANLAAWQGHTHYTHALTSRDPKAAEQAVLLLDQGTKHLGPDYASLRALDLSDLAGSYALTGDPDTAVTVGHQAIDAVTTVASPRAHDRLRTLHTVLEPVQTSPGVTELCHRLAATTAT